jgi:spermidine synthase
VNLTPRIACCSIVLPSGMALLLQELLAAGWMAPVFGSGMDVWAAVLSVTLTALALGYGLGSVRTNRLATLAGLAWLTAGAGLALLVCTFWLGPWSAPAPGQETPLALAGYALALLGLPVLLLAVVSPWVVHRLAETGMPAGSAAGLLLALSTLAGVVGALAAGYWSIPFLGLRQTALNAAWLLALAPLIVVLFGAGARLHGGCAAAVLLAAAAGFQGCTTDQYLAGDGRRVVLREDSWYGRREVIEDGVRRHLLVNGVLQTGAALDVPEYFGLFQPGGLLAAGNAMEYLPYCRPAGREALFIGLGGGDLPGALAPYGWRIECVELDPGMVRIAREHFGYKGAVHAVDGRRFLRGVDRQYDFVILDVYRGEDLPSHVFTREAFTLAAQRLRDDGILALNLIGSFPAADTGAVLRTLRLVLPHVELHALGSGPALGPMTVLASRTELAAPLDLRNVVWDDYEILTDDRNPLRTLRGPVARAWRRASLQRYGAP